MSVAATQEQPSEVARTTVSLQLVVMRVRKGRLELFHAPRADGSMLPVFVPGASDEISGAAEQRGRLLVGSEGLCMQLEVRGTPEGGLTAAYVDLVRPGQPGRAASAPVAGWSWRDHRRIPLSGDDSALVERAIDFIAQKLEQGPVGFGLVGEEFTVSELRSVHEAILRVTLDPSNFRKRVSRLVKEGRVKELPSRRATATRPARLYSLA